MKRKNTKAKQTIAEHWRINDPAKFAGYVSALEVIHEHVLRDARLWLDVEPHLIGGTGGDLVDIVLTARDGRRVYAPLTPDARESSSAVRQQIVKLAGMLDRQPRTRKRSR